MQQLPSDARILYLNITTAYDSMQKETVSHFEQDTMARTVVPEADAIIGKPFKVLDRGFVMLVDYMGGDSSIVQAARTSYGKGTKKKSDDEGLIRYLMRHGHTTPFEMVEIKLFAKMPIFVARQWVRHRTASINEYSLRYSLVDECFYVPEPENISAQSKSNRQGREGLLPSAEVDSFRKDLENTSKEAYANYIKHVDAGVARELARALLPVNFYTQWYWKTNLHNMFHFLKLRLDQHAQFEIQSYADAVANITKSVAPVAYSAFEDYELNAVRLSSKEQRALQNTVNGTHSVDEAVKGTGLRLDNQDGIRMKSGEGIEAVSKISGLIRK